MKVIYVKSDDDNFIMEAYLDSEPLEPIAWIREIESGFVVCSAISVRRFKTLKAALEYIEK